MASFKINGMDELTISLSQLAQTPEDVQYSMLEAGAAVLVEAWKKALEPMKRTGLLIESIKAKRKKGDAPIVAVTPDGTRRSEYRGIRKTKAMGGRKKTNAEVAYVLEYGTPRMAARHWMEKANEEASDNVVAAEAAVWDDYLKNLNL